MPISRLALPLTILLLVPFGSCGSSDPKEASMQTQVQLMDKVAQALESVTSKETAQKAVQTIKDLVPQMKAAAQSLKGLGEPSKELLDKYKPEFEAAKKRIQEAVVRLAQYGPEGMQVLQEMMQASGDL